MCRIVFVFLLGKGILVWSTPEIICTSILPSIIVLLFSSHVSNPSSLSLSYSVYHGLFFPTISKHFFICNMLCPTDFFHSSPYQHFEGLQSFDIFFSYGV